MRSGLALFAGMVLAAVLVAAPASADQARDGRFEPVCAGALARVACQVQKLAGTRDQAPADQAPMGWGAQDLQRSHDIPPFSLHPGTVAIIDVGAYPVLEGDLGVYRSQYGLPPCTSANGCFRQLDYRGGPPLAPAKDPDGAGIDEQIAIETALDVDMASAACPDCRIMEIQIPQSEVPTTGPHGTIDYDGYAAAFGTAVQTAVAQGADAVSMSYGLPGDEAMLHGPVAAQLAPRGVAVVASSGDSGFEANEFLWPQALPSVTAVGGTTLVKDSGRYSEGAWSGGGSSCAPGAAPPAGQPAEISKTCAGARAGTDISAVAENLAIYDTYSPQTKQPPGWTVVAGTSASAPFVAGVYAASGSLSGVQGPNLLYRMPGFAFHDITSGTNGGISNGRCLPPEGIPSDPAKTFDERLCGAGAGWDGPTGLGSPRGLFHLLGL